LVIVMLAVLFVGLYFLFSAKPTGFLPTEDEGRFYVTYEMPEATSTIRSVDLMKSIMKKLEGMPNLKVVGGIAGLNIISFSNKSNVGTLFVNLKPWGTRKGDANHVKSVMAEFQKRTSDIKEARVLAISPPAIPGLGQTAGFTFELQQTTSADNVQQFERVARTFLAELNKRPEIGMAFTFFTARTPSYQAAIDREKAKKLGINLVDAYSTLGTLLGSSYVNDFNIYGRNFRVMAQADTAYRTSIDDFSKYFVRNSQGGMVPLSSIVTTKLIEAPSLVSHLIFIALLKSMACPSRDSAVDKPFKLCAKLQKHYLPDYGYEFAGLSREEVKPEALSL